MAASTTTKKTSTATDQPGSLDKDEAKKQDEIAKAEKARQEAANSTGVQDAGLQPPNLNASQEERLVQGIDRAEKATDKPAEPKVVYTDKFVIAEQTDSYHREAVSVAPRGWVGPAPLIVAKDDWKDLAKAIGSF